MVSKNLVKAGDRRSGSDGSAPHTVGSSPASTPVPISSPSANGRSDQAELEALTKELSERTALHQAGLKIGSCLTLNEVILALYQESGRLVDTANFALAIYDDQSDALTFSLVFDQGQRVRPFSVKRSQNQGLVSDLLTRPEPLLVQDLPETNQPLQSAPIRSGQPVRSWLGVPLRHPVFSKEEALGVMVIWSSQPNAFTGYQAGLLATLGSAAAGAIRNIRLLQASQRQAMELAVINDMAQTLASTLQLDEVLNRIMAQIEGMLKVEAGALLLTDPATGELVFQIALGRAERAKDIEPFRLPQGRDAASYVAQTGKALLIPRVDPDKQRFIKLAAHLGIAARNLLCVPLVLYEQVIGVLAVMNRTEGSFSQNDLTLLKAIAPYAAIAIENARLHEGVLAERDRVMEIEEGIRQEVARDLHDGPTQLVSAILMRLDFCQKALQKDPSLLPGEMIGMQKLGQQALHQMRTLLVELRPLELEQHGQGLAAALRVFLERRQREVNRTKLVLEINPGRPSGQISRLEAQVETAIFIIVQETVNNALKHARANHILVHLEETPSAIYTLIADDGRGFDVAQVMDHYTQRASLGMINIQERAEAIGGELIIDSTPGRGTYITLKVPKAKAERLRKRGTTGRLTLPPNMLQNEAGPH